MIHYSAVRVPYPPYAWRIARTAALVWLALHVGVALLGFFVPDPSLLLPGYGAGFLIGAIAALLVWVDLRRSHEHLFHANLGTSPAWSVGIALGVAGTLELLVQLVSRALISSSGGAFLG